MTGRNIQQFSYRIQLVEGLFTKYARAEETRSVPGRQASDNTVPWLTERHFLRKLAPKTEKSKPQRCDVGLCLEDCFELFHTKLTYRGNDNYFTAFV